MHAVGVREDVVEVGEDVVGRERDKLASTPEHLAEEVVSVVGVGEGDVEDDDDAVDAAIVLLVEVCYLLSNALDFPEEERMMQQSSISISLRF